MPVSLGIVLDTSGSMAGEKIDEAQTALDRFVYELLDEQDEIFLYRFSNDPVLLQDWTTRSPAAVARARRITPNGGTAMYDAVLEAVPLAAAGQQPEEGAAGHLRRQRHGEPRRRARGASSVIRESEVLVYAIGIDGESASRSRAPPIAAARADSDSVSVPGGRRRPAALPHDRPRSVRPAAAADRARDAATIASTSSRCAT